MLFFFFFSFFSTFLFTQQDNYDIVVTKLVLYSNKMMKKYDASTCVSLCSHLFWTADEVGKRSLYGYNVLDPCVQIVMNNLR